MRCAPKTFGICALVLLFPLLQATAANDCPKAARILARAERIPPGDEKVIELLAQATKLCPSLAAAHYLQGVVHFEHGQLEQAKQEFSQAIKQGNEPRFSNALGRVYLQEKDFKAAKLQFEKTLEHYADNASALQGLAFALFELNQLPEAEHALQRALQVQSESEDLFYNLGVVLEAQEKREQAVDSYQAALERRPGFPEAARRLADLQLYLGQVDAADETLSSVSAKDQETAEMLITRAALLDRQGKTEKALELLERAQAAGIDSADAHFNRAVLLAKQGSSDDAKKIFQDLVTQYPNDSRFHAGLGWLHLRSEEFEAAERELTRALALDEQNANAAFNLGLLYEKRGEEEQARKSFQRAVELRPSSALFRQTLQRLPSKEVRAAKNELRSGE